jgi:Ca2+/Na+ antiporter
MSFQSDQQIFLVLLIAPVLALFLLSLHRRRDGVRHYLRRVILSEVVYVFATIYLVKQHVYPLAAIAFGALAGVAVERLLIKRRSRHIPASEKRKAILRYERKTGRKYNRKEDEFDHEIAFSRGGSSTADNLRIRPRSENRSKGKKSPWWDLLG